MMSVNPGYPRYLGGPTPFVTDPLEQAILHMDKMIESCRLNALPLPFDLYRAKRILEGCCQCQLSVEVRADTAFAANSGIWGE